MTRYTITTTEGSVHSGIVQGSGGRLRGDHGLKILRLASQGRPVNVYDPTGRPPFTTGRVEITHVTVFETDDAHDFEAVAILGARVTTERPSE